MSSLTTSPGLPGDAEQTPHHSPLTAAICWERRHMDELNPAEYNPRKRLQPGDREYEKLKHSIETFGYVDPIIVNADGTVIGGHQRLNVLIDLGYTEADVAVVDLEKSEEKALNIALNKINGEWDEEKLADLFQELRLEDIDLSLTGFDEDELDDIFASLIEPEPSEDDGFDVDGALEDVSEPETQIGDIYQLGPHRLMCGDSTQPEAIARLMGGATADLLLTDPPTRPSECS